MKRNLLFLKILILWTLYSCQEAEPEPVNLIGNSSFETNGHGSLDCWTIVKDFSTYSDTFSTDVPTNGGLYSLRLEGIKDVNWDPYVETFVTSLSGNKIISLSAYIKSIYGGQAIYLQLDQIRNGTIISSKENTNWAFNGWIKFEVRDSLSLEPIDSLRVKIIQTTGQNSSSYIDLVELIAR